MSTTLTTTEGMLVAILPFGVLGTLGTWYGGRMLRWGCGLLWTRYRKLDSQRPFLKAPKAMRSSVSGQREYSWLKRPAYSLRGPSSPYRSLYKSSAEYRRSVWIVKWSRNALASDDRLEGVDIGERILRASIEGDAEWLNVFLLVIIEDTFGKEPRSCLRPEGLVAATVPAISINVDWFMGPVLRWGDVKEPRLGHLRMEGAFTLAEPRLDWGTMAGVHLLVWLGMLSILGKVICSYFLDILAMLARMSSTSA
ncbi:unnamed protein product [Prunus brigantina]